MASGLDLLRGLGGTRSQGCAQTAPAPCGDVELPDLRHAALDWDGVDCVLADLDDFTSIVELRGRTAAGEIAPLNDLPDARDQLVSGALCALQIVYRFADETWCDTLLREGGGARLSRMISPTHPAEDSAAHGGSGGRT